MYTKDGYIIGVKSMTEELLNKIVCPFCKTKLYKIDSIQNGLNIKILFCFNCISKFLVVNNSINFNINYKDKYSLEKNLKKILLYEKDSIIKLLNANNKELNISDIYIKLEYYKMLKDYKNIQKIYEEFDFDIYSIESKQVLYKAFDKLSECLLDKSDKYILDFAAGNCIMSEYLNSKSIFLNYIINDISINNLLVAQNRNRLKKSNISYLAFDICNGPFKEKSIDYAISFVGFQNIANTTKVIYNLSKIVRNSIYHISTFCDETDKVNLMALRMSNMNIAWVKSNFIQLLKNFNIKYKEIYSEKATIHPLPYGKIIKGFRSDRFPIKETVLEYNLGELIL